MTKKKRKNKDDSFISTYQTLQNNFNNQEINTLDAIACLFQTQKRIWFNDKDRDRPNFIQKQKIVLNNKVMLPFTYRFFQGIRQEVSGMEKSIDSNRKNYLVDINSRLVSHKKSLKKKSDKYKNGVKFQDKLNISDEKIKKNLFYLRSSYKKLYSLQNQIHEITINTKNKHYPICFGGKKLLNERHSCSNEQEVETWKKEWNKKRNGNFMLVGSHDETQGNSSCQLFYDEKSNQFNFKLPIPNVLKEKYGNELVLKNITIPSYCRDQVKFEVLKHQNNDKEKESLSFRFIKKEKGYAINIGLNIKKKIIKTTSKLGVVGLDINPDNLAVTEVNQFGDFLHSFVIPMDLEGKSSEQSMAIIGDSIKRLMNFCEETNKHLIVEDLNFKKKRSELHKSKSIKYSQMLSSFAYQKVLSLIEIQSYKRGIFVKKVNPAYTSVIGKTHFSIRLGLSDHQGAAMVIARRFYECKEIIKKVVTIRRKSRV